MTLFLATFTTLLAIINPLEALPIYLGFIQGKDDAARLRLAWRSCLYALLLMFFFLIFGTLLLKLFDVPLSMIRIAGGIILTQLGFALFSKPSSVIGEGAAARNAVGAAASAADEDVAFVPLAMPIMFGPGAMATILGMASVVRPTEPGLWGFVSVSAALLATMAVTFVILLSAKQLQRRLGPRGIDAATRIVGFFVASIGIGMAFSGVMEALHAHGFTTVR